MFWITAIYSMTPENPLHLSGETLAAGAWIEGPRRAML
jgi:hypothetical protein